MNNAISFFVQGIPKAQPRVRFATRGKFGHAYTPDSADGWKERVALAAKPYIGNHLDGPMRVSILFYFPRPKSHYNSRGALKPNAPFWHTIKPDRDNLDKLILDTLTKLGAWGDDCQVCAGSIEKLYAPTPESVGARITIECLT